MRETLNKYAENRVHQNVFRPAKKGLDGRLRAPSRENNRVNN